MNSTRVRDRTRIDRDESLAFARLRDLARELLRTGRPGCDVADEHDDRRRDSRRRQEIRSVLLGYLADCPKATDTLDGIASFWIPRQRVRTEVLLLSEVLRDLTAEGILEASGRGRTRRYRLRPPGKRS